MKIRAPLIASAIGLLCLATSSVAEPPIGSRLGNRLTKGQALDEPASARQAHSLASCIVNRRAPEAKRLLSQTNDAGYTAAYKVLTGGEIDCISLFFEPGSPLAEGRSLNIPTDIFRGMLAEEFISRDAPRYAAAPNLPRQLAYSRPWYGASGRDVSIDEMATCVSEIDAGAILALLRTPPYSDSEMSAFGSVVPDMTGCLRAGVKLTGNRQALRAALADALYQRIANPAPVAAPAPLAAPAAPPQ